MDTHFFEAPLRGNIPVLLGLIGVWNSSFLGHPARVILPCKLLSVCLLLCVLAMSVAIMIYLVGCVILMQLYMLCM